MSDEQYLNFVKPFIKFDINKITKEILFTCYNTFYHPNNMFLVITGNFNEEELLNAIYKVYQKKDMNYPY